MKSPFVNGLYYCFDPDCQNPYCVECAKLSLESKKKRNEYKETRNEQKKEPKLTLQDLNPTKLNRMNNIGLNLSSNSRYWCDSCGQTITGTRYNCSVCFNFDFCSTCEETKEHPHPFLKIKKPKQEIQGQMTKFG